MRPESHQSGVFFFVFQALLSISNTALRGTVMAGSGRGGRSCPGSGSVPAKLGCSPVLVPPSPACAVAACECTAESSTGLDTHSYACVEMYVAFF